jgi:lysophospholipase L1-like esterase
MRAVAQRQGVALIDLNTISTRHVQAMGQAEADTLAMEPPPSAVLPALAGATETVGAVKSTFDRTHVGDKGAQLFADMVAEEARKLVGLKGYFKP